MYLKEKSLKKAEILLLVTRARTAPHFVIANHPNNYKPFCKPKRKDECARTNPGAVIQPDNDRPESNTQRRQIAYTKNPVRHARSTTNTVRAQHE